MADKLLAFYNEAKNLGGLKAQIRLAILTGLPASKAALEPDSQENIDKFKKAMAEIQKEFK